MTKPDGKLLVVFMDIRISIKKQAAGKPGCLNVCFASPVLCHSRSGESY
jgi:hypothetical protein